jgi:hypothetical protein
MKYHACPHCDCCFARGNLPLGTTFICRTCGKNYLLEEDRLLERPHDCPARLAEREQLLSTKRDRQAGRSRPPKPLLEESTGLGDDVSHALSKVGITEERVSAWLGRPCGCGERRRKLNQLGSWAKSVMLGEASSENLESIIEGK